VDGDFRSSVKGVFAAGNLLRGVAIADHCALEGGRAAQSIARYLKNAEWPANRLEVWVEAPIAWVCPNAIEESSDVATFKFRSREFKKNIRLVVKQGEKVLHMQPFRQLIVNEIMYFDGGWTRKVDLDGAMITVGLQATE
jgi:hypothetical protein